MTSGVHQFPCEMDIYRLFNMCVLMIAHIVCKSFNKMRCRYGFCACLTSVMKLHLAMPFHVVAQYATFDVGSELPWRRVSVT